MSTFRIEIVIPYVVDELESLDEALNFGHYLASDFNHEFEVRAEEIDNDE